MAGKPLLLNEKLICDLYNGGKTMKQIIEIINKPDVLQQGWKSVKSSHVIKRILVRNGIKIKKTPDYESQVNPPIIRKNYVNVNYFKDINSPEKAYWFGFLLADGCIHKSKYKVSLISKDKEILENFREAIESEHPISINKNVDYRTKKIYISYQIQVTSKEFCDNLMMNGFIPGKSYRTKLPTISDDLISHMIRGLFDGDGCLCICGNSIRMSFIANQDIMDFISNSLNKFIGIEYPENLSIVKDTIKKRDVYGDNIKKILEFMYKNSNEKIRLSRKYDRYINYFYNKIKYLLCDVDGTIIETKNIHFVAFQKAFGENTGIFLTQKEHDELYDGLPTKEKLKGLSLKFHIDEIIQKKIYEDKQKYTEEMLLGIKYFNPKAKRVFTALKKRGFKIALCSNMTRDRLNIVIDKLHIRELCDLILSNEDVSKCKPDPEMYLKCLDFFKAKPEECISVEDNINGIKSAEGAGIKCVKVNSSKDLNLALLLKYIYQ